MMSAILVRSYPPVFLQWQLGLTAIVLAIGIAILCAALLRGWRPSGKIVGVIGLALFLSLYAQDALAFYIGCDWLWFTVECWLP